MSPFLFGWEVKTSRRPVASNVIEFSRIQAALLNSCTLMFKKETGHLSKTGLGGQIRVEHLFWMW